MQMIREILFLHSGGWVEGLVALFIYNTFLGMMFTRGYLGRKRVCLMMGY